MLGDLTFDFSGVILLVSRKNDSIEGVQHEQLLGQYNR